MAEMKRTTFELQLWEELAELQETLDDAIVRRDWPEVRRAADVVERILRAVEQRQEAR